MLARSGRASRWESSSCVYVLRIVATRIGEVVRILASLCVLPEQGLSCQAVGAQPASLTLPAHGSEAH